MAEFDQLEKIVEILRHGRELNPGHEEDSEIHSLTELLGLIYRSYTVPLIIS